MSESLAERIAQMRQQGRQRAALGILRNHPDFKSCDMQKLACILCMDLGKTKEVLDYCIKYDDANIKDIGFYTDVGNFLLSKAYNKQAVSIYQKVVQIKPDWAIGHYNLANAYTNNIDNAIKHYNIAIQLDKDFYWAYLNRGQAYKSAGKYQLAEIDFKTAMSFSDIKWESILAMGELAQAQENWQLALAYYREALDLYPKRAIAWFSIAGILIRQNNLAAAEQHLLNAVQLEPNNIRYLMALATLYLDSRIYDKAIKYFKTCLKISANICGAYLGLADIATKLGEQNLANINFNKAFELDKRLEIFCAMIMNLNYDSKYSSMQLFNKTLQINYWLRDIKPLHLTINKNKKLHLGFISADFCSHSCSYFSLPLFENLDKDICKLYLYSNNIIDDQITHNIKNTADVWRQCDSLNDEALAQIIANDKIDCLIDLSGLTGGNRLRVFAYRPAKVQMTWLGYPNTTGINQIDYRITDKVSETSDAQNFYSEKLLYMPNIFLCYRPPSVAPDIKLRQKSNFYFGSFNNSLKIGDDVIQAWAKILNLCPNASLLLKNSACESMDYRQRIINNFANFGIDKQRLIFKNRTIDIESHLNIYAEVDLALDTFIYNGTTTTCEAIWMGVPTLCFYGNRHAGRVSASILNSIGLNEFIADNLNDYINKAIEYYNRQDYLSTIRNKLRDKMANSSLCNEKQFADDFLKHCVACVK